MLDRYASRYKHAAYVTVIQLYEHGDIAVPFFVVVSDELEIMCPFGAAAETLVTIFGPSQLTGEVNTISGRRTFFRVHASTPGKIIELDRQHMLALMQTDPEPRDIMMRAFIVRRVELVAAGMGDVVLIGSTHSVGTLRIKEFLTRNGYPYSYIDLDHDHDVQSLLDSFGIDASEIPLVICRGQVVLRNPCRASEWIFAIKHLRTALHASKTVQHVDSERRDSNRDT